MQTMPASRLESAGTAIGMPLSRGGDLKNDRMSLTSTSFNDAMALTSSSWVHQSVSNFERDAANHWTKWGCGGKHLATELWSICQELQHVCATDEGKWLPDMRMQRIHEQLLFIVHGLSKQPPHGMGQEPNNPLNSLPALTPRTPPAVMKNENARLRRELTASKAKVDALEHMFTAYVYSKDTIKARDEWLTKYGLKGRFFAYDVTYCSRSFSAWKSNFYQMKRSRQCAVLGANQINRLRDEQLAELEPICFQLWNREHRLVLARKHVANKGGDYITKLRRAMLENQVGWLVKWWGQEAVFIRMSRDLTNAYEKNELDKHHWLAERKGLCERFAECAMATLRRMIGKDQLECIFTAFSTFLEIVLEIKAERAAKLAAEEAAKRLWERQQAMAARMFGRNKVTLLTTVIRGWIKEMEQIRQAKLRFEMGMSIALRAMFGSEQALKQWAFVDWHEDVTKEKRERQKREMEAARKALAMARERAVQMLIRKAGIHPEELILETFDAWRDDFVKDKLNRFRKQVLLGHMLRALGGKDRSLTDKAFGYWLLYLEWEKSDRELRYSIEQEFRNRVLTLAQNTIMRLHRKLGVNHIFEAWYRRARGEL